MGEVIGGILIIPMLTLLSIRYKEDKSFTIALKILRYHVCLKIFTIQLTIFLKICTYPHSVFTI